MSVHPWHIPSKSFIKGEREGIRSCFETLLNPSVGSHTGTIDLSSLSSYITHTVRNISNLFFLFHKFNTPSPSSMETKNPNYLFFLNHAYGRHWISGPMRRVAPIFLFPLVWKKGLIAIFSAVVVVATVTAAREKRKRRNTFLCTAGSIK